MTSYGVTICLRLWSMKVQVPFGLTRINRSSCLIPLWDAQAQCKVYFVGSRLRRLVRTPAALVSAEHSKMWS